VIHAADVSGRIGCKKRCPPDNPAGTSGVQLWVVADQLA